MGFFGPTIRIRKKGGLHIYYGKCDECKKEHSSSSEYDVKKALKACAKKDKKHQEETEGAKARARSAEQKLAVIEENKRKLKQVQRERADKAKHFRRMAKDKCPYCRKEPCKGKKPKCAVVQAAGWESSMNIDVGDMATFDSQLKWHKDNM